MINTRYQFDKYLIFTDERERRIAELMLIESLLLLLPESSDRETLEREIPKLGAGDLEHSLYHETWKFMMEEHVWTEGEERDFNKTTKKLEEGVNDTLELFHLRAVDLLDKSNG